MAKPLSKNAYIKLAVKHSSGNQANNKKEKNAIFLGYSYIL